MAKVDEIIAAYVKIRDSKTKITRDHKDAIGVLDEQLDKLAAVLGTMLTDAGVESFKTATGTAFKATKDQVGVLEIEEFREFLSLETAGGDKAKATEIFNNFPWHFFTKAVSKPSVVAYMKEHEGQIPDGLRYDQFIETQVRK